GQKLLCRDEHSCAGGQPPPPAAPSCKCARWDFPLRRVRRDQLKVLLAARQIRCPALRTAPCRRCARGGYSCRPRESWRRNHLASRDLRRLPVFPSPAAWLKSSRVEWPRDRGCECGTACIARAAASDAEPLPCCFSTPLCAAALFRPALAFRRPAEGPARTARACNKNVLSSAHLQSAR